MMRSIQLWGLVGATALLFAGQGCHLSFDVHAGGQAQIQSGGLLSSALEPLGPLGNFASFDISQTQDFKNQGVSKSHLESVKLKSLTLQISQPQGETFQFLDSIEFYAQTDGQPQVRVAHKDAVPHDATSFAMDLDDAELVDYVSAPSMSITAKASGRPPNQDTTIDIAADFGVVAKL